MIRQPGRVVVGPEVLLVEMDQSPLDIVIDMAGYKAEIELVPWLDRRVRFG